MKSAEEDAYGFTPNVSLSLPLGGACLPSQFPGTGFYSPPGARPNGAPALESPRIEITAYGQFPEDEAEESGAPPAGRLTSIVTLTLPGADGYRDPSCLSPASSVSSRSGLSDASYESGFSCAYDYSPQGSPLQSPSVSPRGSSLAPPGGGSPRPSPSSSPRASVTDESWAGQRGSRPGSRPGSPCGAKRKYTFNGGGAGAAPHRHFPYSPTPSPGPSPQTSPRLSVTEDSWLPNTNQYTNSAILAAINALTTDGVGDLGDGVPTKARKTSAEHGAPVGLKVEPGGEEPGPGELGPDDPAGRPLLKRESYGGGFLDVPQFCWPKPKQYLSSSLPALDWQLPATSNPYSLQIEVQPKSHHRAHYETEGSRGAVKALAGGHPIVQLHGYMDSEPLTLQLFIGTADDRLLRPHAFYQVHRITGKTVSTPSHEALHHNTKVLEIPLLPENNMRAIIDCAGILKLRNSDIELRKGETDIGRKNTRVRMVFRVHVNQSSSRTVSLQVASNPIECSQRSAQELPLVDKQSLDSSPASGGERMLLDGHNFQPDSKVVFVEKAQDGHHLWETEAKVERDPSKPNFLLVEIPPYRNQRLSTPVHVNFYVCNGKRKRSQYQRFTYVPASVPTIKTEPHDDYDAALVGVQHGPSLSLLPKPFYPPQGLTPLISDLRPCVVGGAYSIPPQRLSAKPPPLPSPGSPSSSPKLHDLSPSPFSKCPPAGPAAPPPGPQSPIGHVSIIQETPGRYQPPIYPPGGSASPPASQTPTSSDAPFSPAHEMTPAPPATQQPPKGPERPRPTAQEDGAPPALVVSIKQEPQELDQMYLDDVNEIIRNDLSSISVHSHA
ncbi:nuclear factor of activated T-cells, cytoplasmic 1 [Cololabis saira]|uniref:nuclear factor of activated T-cells, cytoplasmic 1 n=1 Tax=Cololabis saira TaxID=129043 RepID=UPI002AD23CE9|nr:nuclear factor of activated T-cells, cytoplasmic 1 [Cololabis saira]